MLIWGHGKLVPRRNLKGIELLVLTPQVLGGRGVWQAVWHKARVGSRF